MSIFLTSPSTQSIGNTLTKKGELKTQPIAPGMSPNGTTRFFSHGLGVVHYAWIGCFPDRAPPRAATSSPLSGVLLLIFYGVHHAFVSIATTPEAWVAGLGYRPTFSILLSVPEASS